VAKDACDAAEHKGTAAHAEESLALVQERLRPIRGRVAAHDAILVVAAQEDHLLRSLEQEGNEKRKHLQWARAAIDVITKTQERAEGGKRNVPAAGQHCASKRLNVVKATVDVAENKSGAGDDAVQGLA
jgi:predicted ATP-grasp superfamily ATP-dependent carboligase